MQSSLSDRLMPDYSNSLQDALVQLPCPIYSKEPDLH